MFGHVQRRLPLLPNPAAPSSACHRGDPVGNASVFCQIKLLPKEPLVAITALEVFPASPPALRLLLKQHACSHPRYLDLFLWLLGTTDPVLRSRRQHQRAACRSGPAAFLAAWVTPEPCLVAPLLLTTCGVLQPELSSVPLCLISPQGFQNAGLALKKEHFNVP